MNTPPLVSFVTWNRCGVSLHNLHALLDTDEDFELHIIDNNSSDHTWAFLQELRDPRIKNLERFDINKGLIYTLNYTLSKRKPEQYFVTIDSDVYIKTPNWYTLFYETMQAYEDIGYLGVHKRRNFLLSSLYPDAEDEVKDNGNVRCWPYHGVWGGMICLRPELLDLVGYFNEETGRGDSDMCMRINNFTPYKTAYQIDITLKHLESIECSSCQYEETCPLANSKINCISIRDDHYPHDNFCDLMAYKQNQLIRDIRDGKRECFCASIHDPASMEKHVYNKDWAMENFQYFIDKAN